MTPEPLIKYSLQKRLVLAFSILLILFLGLAGVVLDRAFKESVTLSMQERLQLQVYALLGVAEPDENSFFVPDLEEARFSQIDSGLYGFIFDNTGEELWRSASALNLNLAASAFTLSAVEPGQTMFGRLEGLEQGALAYAAYGTYWANLDSQFSFVAMESEAPTAAEIRGFQSSLYVWFGALALFLSIAQFMLLRWGLQPLQKLALDVASIEAGDKDQLESSYPSELKSVTDNLNLLIKSERERQSRYRTTLGDLAHSLKTPLAVISGIIQSGQKDSQVSVDNMGEVQEQLERMNQIVSWQLKRAVKSNGSALLLRPVLLGPVVEKLLGALSKVYQDKGITVSKDIDSGATFYGEESDLMELVGNLLDNAFKYGNSKVAIYAQQQGKTLVLEIADDGDGIAEADRNFILERGARADTVKSGQGIGLAVAVDIISSYGGEISVAQSAFGGALIKVKLGPEQAARS